jgi:hypothetical protein
MLFQEITLVHSENHKKPITKNEQLKQVGHIVSIRF